MSKTIGKELRPLYDLGFALHWVKPRSKRPVEMAWAKGPKKKWKELRESHVKGMNVGVRLGSPSKVGDLYLAVIDCDVKGKAGKFDLEMQEKLEELTGSAVNATPVVLSGRGNGSKHIYVLTERPARFQRLAQSKRKVKVHMPSAEKPSSFEKENLTAEELASGIRLRAAWEISIMGEGQQVVLPPSIHPDSGKRYEWWRPLRKREDLWRFKLDQTEVETREETREDFEAVVVDLFSSKVPEATVDQILSGEGVNDRSAALLGVANTLLRSGLTDNEILSVLTDRENFLGEVAYDHAKTESRKRAAEWVRRYTLEKAKRETSAAEVFKAEVIETTLDDAAAALQQAELCPELTWRELIERGSIETGARPKNTLKNVIRILQGEGGKDVFKRDEFANAEIYGQLAPWGSKVGAEVSDLDTMRIKEWLADNWRFEPSNDRINEAISVIADKNRFHPVKEYLNSLTWDGTPRVDSWLKTYMGARAAEPYLSAVSRKTLCAMVARIYQPGVKFDYVLILENVKQGVGKSTSVKKLAGDQWFSDAHINISDKDAVLTMRSIWVVELGELSGMRKADVDQMKEFISRTTDRIRVPYGKRSENFPRQCIFIGTTNSKEYLKDPTGNRRFWPVEVGVCDFKAIEVDRDQLLAEAKFLYELGEPLYLEDQQMTDASVVEQESRTISDPWHETISEWLSKEKPADEDDDNMSPLIDRKRFRTGDLFSPGGPLANIKMNLGETIRVSSVLRKLGFVSKAVWMPREGTSWRFWVREGSTVRHS